MKMKYIGIIMIVVMLSIVTVNAETDHLDFQPYENHQLQMLERSNDWIEQSQINNELTQSQIAEIMNKFINQLVQEVDEHYKVKKYDTLKQLKKSFSNIASDEVVNQFVDFYFIEEDDGLYIIPTDTPPWFEVNEKYELEKIKENIFRVTQSNFSELHGSYTIVIDIELKENGEPFIINIQYK